MIEIKTEICLGEIFNLHLKKDGTWNYKVDDIDSLFCELNNKLESQRKEIERLKFEKFESTKKTDYTITEVFGENKYRNWRSDD